MFHQEDITVKIFNEEMEEYLLGPVFYIYTGDICGSGSRSGDI